MADDIADLMLRDLRGHLASGQVQPRKGVEALRWTMLFAWTFALRRATEHLTDEEFFWEPVRDCWGVRRLEDAQTPDAHGGPEWVVDWDNEVGKAPPGAAPFTTIGWRLAHICDAPAYLTSFTFLGGTVEPPARPSVRGDAPSCAADAVARLTTGWVALWHAAGQASEDDLDVWWTWDFGPTNGRQHIALMLNELVHHGAEIGVLRDLHRASAGRRLV